MAHTAGELAKYLGAKLHGDAHARIAGVANPESARADDLIYVDAPKHAERAARSAANCVIVPPRTPLAGKTLLEVANPKLAFAKAAAWLLPRASHCARKFIPRQSLRPRPSSRRMFEWAHTW